MQTLVSKNTLAEKLEMTMKLPKGYRRFDVAIYLKRKKDIDLFLEAACADNDPAHIAHAIGLKLKLVP